MDLRDLAGDVAPDRAAEWILRLAKALEQLHEQGRVHTRVGLAAVAIDSASPRGSARLVVPAELEARVDHRNPERLFGATADAADDVWAAGVALYHLVTGVLPYQAASELEVMALIEAAPPAPISSHGCEHAELQGLLDQVLTLDRATRISTAHDLRRALSALVANDDLPALDLPDVGDTSIAWAEQGGPTSARGSAIVPVADAPPPEIATAQAAETTTERPAKKKKVRKKKDGTRARSKRRAGTNERPSPEGQRAAQPPVKTSAGKGKPGGDEPGKTKSRVPAALLIAAVAIAGGLWLYRADGEPGVSSTTPTSESKPAATARRPPGTETTTTRPPPTAVAAPVRSVAAVATAPSGASATPAASSTAASSAAASSTAASSTAAGPPAPVAAAAGQDASACMVAWLPPDSFGDYRPSFASLCTEDDPLAAHDAIIAELVRGAQGRGLTGAMTQWASLGWYEMAAVAAAQARCCTTPPRLTSAPGFAPCKLDDALVQIGKSVRAGQAERDAAIDGYTAAITCLSSVDLAFKLFQQKAKPGPAGLLQLHKLLDGRP